MELITTRLRLREFGETDFQAMREMDSRPEMHTYERELPSIEETRKSLEECISHQKEMPRTTFRLAMTIPPQDTVRGVVKLTRQWEFIREWEVGWAVHPEDWGKGYATEAAWYLLDWGFRELNIHRMVAFCHASNAASVRVMEKLGMHQDGRLRETRWLNGEWWDEYVFAILEKEWQSYKDLKDFKNL
jgi:ribosomal-protein-alanine N-acetyltransferase